jgi:hypothetical protein
MRKKTTTVVSGSVNHRLLFFDVTSRLMELHGVPEENVCWCRKANIVIMSDRKLPIAELAESIGGLD